MNDGDNKKSVGSLRRSLSELLGSRRLRTIEYVFDCTAVAEEELDGVPEHREIFRWLQPPAGFEGKSREIYRHHCKELIERFRSGAKPSRMEELTDAEILCGVIDSALVAPLNSTGMLVANRLMLSVMGTELDVQVREAWPGQVDEALAKLRRRKRR